MGRIKTMLLGAARLFDFGGSLRARRARRSARTDWEMLCRDGEAVQRDFRAAVNRELATPDEEGT